MNASYVDDLEGIGKVIVTQVNLLNSWMFDGTTYTTGPETEYGVGLLADGSRAQGATYSDADKQSRTGQTKVK